jgi:hypothetical protein
MHLRSARDGPGEPPGDAALDAWPGLEDRQGRQYAACRRCPGRPTAPTWWSRSASVARRCTVAVGLLAGHLHYYVVNAAHASEDGGQASLGGVASTIRQVIRL